MTLPLVAVFGVLVVLSVRYDGARVHHIVIGVLFGISIGVSIWGGEIWALIVQLAQLIGAAFTRAS